MGLDDVNPDNLSDEEILAIINAPSDEESEGSIKVEGKLATFEVLSVEEAEWFNRVRGEYEDQYRFDNVADQQDLDRLLGMELLAHRYTIWLLEDSDYDNHAIDIKGISDRKGKLDQEIRLLKQHMGMNRKNRIESEQESVGDFLSNLLRRAEEFGVHRDNQIAEAIDILQEIFKLVGLHDRCDDEERRHLGVLPENILDWIRDTAKPKYEAIDDAFRVNQRLWIKDVS